MIIDRHVITAASIAMTEEGNPGDACDITCWIGLQPLSLHNAILCVYQGIMIVGDIFSWTGRLTAGEQWYATVRGFSTRGRCTFVITVVTE